VGLDDYDDVAAPYAHLGPDELEDLEAERQGCLTVLGGSLFLLGLLTVCWAIVLGAGWRVWQIVDVFI
jgi:hypothetical protein